MVSYISALLFSLLIHSSFGVPNQTLTIICSKTENPKRCVTNLQSDPRTASADLPKLSLVSIELTMAQGDHNLKTFKELGDNTTRDELKREFHGCVELYQQMKPKIQAAHLLSQHRQYKNVSDLAQAKEFAFRCGLAITINSLVINEIQELMYLTCETSITVNQYIARSSA